MLQPDLSSEVISAAFAVHNTIRPGHLEHVYQNALAVELANRGIRSTVESRLDIKYAGVVVGFCEADLIVERTLVVETKALDAILPGHLCRLRAYLRRSGYQLGLVL